MNNNTNKQTRKRLSSFLKNQDAVRTQEMSLIDPGHENYNFGHRPDLKQSENFVVPLTSLFTMSPSWSQLAFWRHQFSASKT